ncbi:MAG: hypothetical protein QF460_01290 [Candidatus Nanoarchaeia archaeon]|jgi:RNase P/RNase MRP subunit p30|nr:hypothetical protein [Candidatus Nanoarchaeia archaeon]
MQDVVMLPSKPEKFIRAARDFGYSDLIFLFEGTGAEFNRLKKRFDVNLGLLFVPKNMDDFQKLKKYDKPVLIIGSATDEKLLRRILENKKIHGFTNVEHESGKDHTHYRRSNMNQVLSKIAHDKNKTYYVNFARVLYSQKRSKLIGRMLQNIKFMNKYRVNISIGSFARDEKGFRLYDNLESFAKVLKARKIKAIDVPVVSNLPKGVRIVG